MFSKNSETNNLNFVLYKKVRHQIPYNNFEC
jgi:hypothetical protein